MLSDTFKKFIAECGRLLSMLSDTFKKLITEFGGLLSKFFGVAKELFLKYVPRAFLHGFAPGSWLCLLLLCLSGLLALGTYEGRQVANQNTLRAELMAADPISHFCQNLPQFSRALCDEKLDVPPKTEQLRYEILLAAEVITRDDFGTAVDLDGNAPREIRVVADKLTKLLTRRYTDKSAGSRAGVTMLSELAGLRCLNADVRAENAGEVGAENAVNPADVRLGKVTAHILADIPGGADTFGTFARSCQPAIDEARALISSGGSEDLPKPVGRRLSSRTCLGASDAMLLLSERAAAVAQPPTNEKQLVGEVGYQIAGVDSRCIDQMRVSGDPLAFSTREFLIAQDNITRLSAFVLAQTTATTEVKSATTILRMWRGPEHIGIIALACFVLAIVVFRIFSLALITFIQAFFPEPLWWRANALGERLRQGGTETWSAQRELEDGRRYQRWALASIPAIGFIGTVRGILNALPEAREVVFASSKLGRADAIGTLAGELGLAFSTTLFALIASLVLSFVLLLASRTEATFLRHLAAARDPAPDDVDEVP